MPCNTCSAYRPRLINHANDARQGIYVQDQHPSGSAARRVRVPRCLTHSLFVKPVQALERQWWHVWWASFWWRWESSRRLWEVLLFLSGKGFVKSWLINQAVQPTGGCHPFFRGVFTPFPRVSAAATADVSRAPAEGGKPS